MRGLAPIILVFFVFSFSGELYATAGGTRSYREVARDFGVTRAEICQYLTLPRKLPAELVESLGNESRPDVLRRMSYRRLLAQARSGPISA
jgi:hypothetical protein